MSVAVGFALQPDLEFLEIAAPVIERAEILEVTPETLWLERPDGALAPNAFHARFAALREGRPFVAHGVGLSVGGSDAGDAARFERWLTAIRELQDVFGFEWYSDHLGVSAPAGLNLALPLPLPATEESIRACRQRLAALRSVVAEVAVENSAQYFSIGDPLDEATLLSGVAGNDGWLLLDLHNLHANAVNLGFDPEAWLRRAPLNRVIEIHLAGGSDSPAEWLPSGRTFRLDSHDAAVPEAVWNLLDSSAPRCPALRAVILERMEGTLAAGDAPALLAEMDRARHALRSRRT